jgi:outer membrane protein assembly factor BamA
VHKPGEEYLAGIEIAGNHTIASEDLLPKLSLARNLDTQRAIDDYQLQLDTQRIATAYEKLGFFTAEVHARIEHKGDAATVVFDVTEGRRAVVHVDLIGLPDDVPVAKARALIQLDENGPFDYDAFTDAKAPLLQLLEDAGYARAALEATVIADRTHAQATLEYNFAPGPRCTFGAIEVTGTDGMLADAVRARLAFATGDRYSTSALLETQTALYRFGRFATVRVRPDRSGDSTVIPVRVAVTEPDLNELRVGVGGGIDELTYFGRLHVAYTRLSFLTPLTTFVADLRPEYAVQRDDSCGWEVWHCGEFRGRLVGTVTQQDLFATDVKGDVELGIDYLTVEAYTKAGGHVRLGLASPILTPRVQAKVGWQYTYSNFIDIFVADPAALGIDRPNYVGAYTGALSVDLRDKPLDPQRGIYAETRVARGTTLAGGDFNYWQVTPDVRAFYAVAGTVIAARGRLGAIWGDVPETERYYGGGMQSQRGFSQRRLSPEDPATGIVVGGAGLVEESIELRRPLGVLSLGGVMFLDGGDVTRAASGLDLTNQHWAIGAGLRYLSPIGPIGVDFAYRLNRYGPGEPEAGHRFNYLLAVGEAF